MLSLTARQIFDCYHGVTLPGDGYAFSSTFPTPGTLPTACTVGAATAIEGLYAGVGSGSGQRGFIANDPHELLQSPTVLTFPLPAALPPYVDGTGVAPFGVYSYPEMDFATSDSPLAFSTVAGWTANSLTTTSYSSFTPAANWQGLATVTAAASATVNYSTAKYGQPIQIPAAEVPVAIAVNVAAPATGAWNIRSALSPNTQPGGAIQLSSAQLCAIFSGAVRDWSSVASIANLTSSGGVATVGSQLFDADNTSATVHTGAQYTSASLPIRVVYRTDGSGTSFIITNYLAAVCPLLDNGTNNYTKIFTGAGVTYPSGVEVVTTDNTTSPPTTVSVTKASASASNLPGNNFVNLIANIKAVRGIDVSTGTNYWVGASGSGKVAAAINNSSANSGRIGYLSNDFTKPYSTFATAPLSASIQDEHQRASGINHPGDSGQNFIAPTPTNGSNAWTHLVAPATTSSYNDWNVYNQVFSATTPTSGGLTLAGKFILPLDYTTNAYPITGTTFLDLYSCYADSTGKRVPAVANFISWLIDGSAAIGSGRPSTSTAASPQYDPDVAAVIQNNGFHQISAKLATAILKQYVTPGSGNNTAIAAYKTTGAQTEGCAGVTGGGAH